MLHLTPAANSSQWDFPFKKRPLMLPGSHFRGLTTGNQEESFWLLALRVRHTPNRFLVNIPYTPIDAAFGEGMQLTSAIT